MKTNSAHTQANQLSFLAKKAASGLELAGDFFQLPDQPALGRLSYHQKIEAFSLLSPKIEPIVQSVREKYMIDVDRPFDWDDFYGIATAEGIELADNEEFARFADELPDLQGCLMSMLGKKVVYLRHWFKPAEGLCDLSTAFHELGHYFLRHQSDVLMRVADDKWRWQINELEAELFAECCLCRWC